MNKTPNIPSSPVALVTGASSGFGLGIARQLIARGYVTYITARNAARLQPVADELGAIALVADVTQPADWDRVITQIQTEQNGRLDVLVNNAGGGISIAPIDEQSDEAICEAIALNLTGAMLGCKRAAALMKNQKSGTIVNISSVCAGQAWPGWGVYGAAKAGLEQFTNHLYVELRAHGVRATCLTPSWGATDFMGAANLGGLDDDTAARSIQPDDIGRVVADLCALPDHLVIPQMTLLPLVQEIVPY